MFIAVLQEIHLLNKSKLILITEWDACNLIFPGALIKDILSEFFFQPFCLHGSFKIPFKCFDKYASKYWSQQPAEIISIINVYKCTMYFNYGLISKYKLIEK